MYFLSYFSQVNTLNSTDKIISPSLFSFYLPAVCLSVFPHIPRAWTRLYTRLFFDNLFILFFFSLQYLLVRHSLLSILFLTAVFFGVAMSGFSLFHLYLVLTNQTTNEFNKRCFGKTQSKTFRQARISAPRTETTTGRTSKRRTTGNKNTSLTTWTKATGEKLLSSRTSTPYNRGIWRNIAEVLRG